MGSLERSRGGGLSWTSRLSVDNSAGVGLTGAGFREGWLGADLYCFVSQNWWIGGMVGFYSVNQINLSKFRFEYKILRISMVLFFTT